MKKLLYGVLAAKLIFALYSYQRPMLSTEEAVVQAYEYLRNPPVQMYMTIEPIQVELNEVPAENIRAVLNPQEGFLNQLINKQQWEVTINYQHAVPTVVLDATTGEFLELSGPLN
ncbi:hypothetical protein [Planococcus shixiaomingii]|uniref:hypothetical protein n=1 Tax=Planococcus shixiaomingii TaxID=3058393 RepID=UPI00262069B8|nr:hypothetical protein [Planococcus sp. N022]WKA56549.1 hypothetical protein QWY21_09435 [Planococcus sp. N022]